MHNIVHFPGGASAAVLIVLAHCCIEPQMSIKLGSSSLAARCSGQSFALAVLILQDDWGPHHPVPVSCAGPHHPASISQLLTLIVREND
eukprot:1799410-Rhodomonas_salina.1